MTKIDQDAQNVDPLKLPVDPFLQINKDDDEFQGLGFYLAQEQRKPLPHYRHFRLRMAVLNGRRTDNKEALEKNLIKALNMKRKDTLIQFMNGTDRSGLGNDKLRILAPLLGVYSEWMVDGQLGSPAQPHRWSPDFLRPYILADFWIFKVKSFIKLEYKKHNIIHPSTFLLDDEWLKFWPKDGLPAWLTKPIFSRVYHIMSWQRYTWFKVTISWESLGLIEESLRSLYDSLPSKEREKHVHLTSALDSLRKATYEEPDLPEQPLNPRRLGYLPGFPIPGKTPKNRIKTNNDYADPE